MMKTLADVEMALREMGLVEAQNIVARARRAILTLHRNPQNALEHALVADCGMEPPTAPFMSSN